MPSNHRDSVMDQELLPLALAIPRALQWEGPVRIVHDDGERLAEIYVNRGCVIHASVNGLDGLPAVAAILGGDALRFHIEPGRWPRRCSMLAPWDSLLREVERLRASRRPPPPRNDDDATSPLV